LHRRWASGFCTCCTALTLDAPQLDAARVAVDPDIDTLPLLAWSADMLQPLSAKERKVVRMQHWLLFPILLLARLSWCMQSMTFPFGGKVAMKRAVPEALAIAGHYCWLLSAAFTCLPPVKVRVTRAASPAHLHGTALTGLRMCPQACFYVLMCQFFCGILLGYVFIQSHNGMEVYSDGRDFVSSQLSSTRNIHGGIFNDWRVPSDGTSRRVPAWHSRGQLRARQRRFTGGLNRQVEHHLFPTLPRHNLGRAQRLLRAFCSKHGLYYEVRHAAKRSRLNARLSDTRISGSHRTAPCRTRPRACCCGLWRLLVSRERRAYIRHTLINWCLRQLHASAWAHSCGSVQHGRGAQQCCRAARSRRKLPVEPALPAGHGKCPAE
jgi:hypothetical protein